MSNQHEPFEGHAGTDVEMTNPSAAPWWAAPSPTPAPAWATTPDATPPPDGADGMTVINVPGSNPASSPDSNTGEGQGLRTTAGGDTAPVANANTAAGRHPDDDGTLPEPEPLIPDDLSVTGPMEDLPSIRPQELKIIGRCVSFIADCMEKGELRDYYFEGMVGQITKDTVTMLEVLKFTVDGFAAFKTRQDTTNVANMTMMGSDANNSRIAAIGTPLPRRQRRNGRGGPNNSVGFASDSQSISHPPQHLPSGAVGADPALTSTGGPESSVLSPLHYPTSPTPAVADANNFSAGAVSADASASLESRMYDYNAYNRTNHYDNSSTLMPDQRPTAVGAGGSAVPPALADTTPVRPRTNPAPPTGEPTAATSGALFTLIQNSSPTNNDAAVWQKDQPLAHYKYMTFARRKIRKVEFSTDHAMAGLQAPYYVSYAFQPHWNPKADVADEPAFEGANADTNANAPDGNGGNTNNGPDGAATAANANGPAAAGGAQPHPHMTAHATAQEAARQAKEKARRHWKEQQAADVPQRVTIPQRHQHLVGVERNTTNPFMGLNLRITDPASYRAARKSYKAALVAFFEENPNARLIAPTAIRGSGALGINTDPALVRGLAGFQQQLSPLVPLQAGEREGRGDPDGGHTNTDGAAPIDLFGSSTGHPLGSPYNGGESSSSDDEDAIDACGGYTPPRDLSSGDPLGVSTEHGPLSPDTRPPTLPKGAADIVIATPASPDAPNALHISLKHVSADALEQLYAEGCPRKPPVYEYPQSIAAIYNEPKWRGNPYLLQDLERVRMFIRRYLVHTSQGNNQKKIPLIIFVTQRCPWPNPPEPLLKEMLHEELKELMRIEGELVAKAHGNDRGNSRGNVNHPDVIGAAGEDINPGRLLLAETGIISRTTYLAIAHIALSIGLLLYAASAFSSLEKYFVAHYADNIAAWVVASAALYLFLGAASGFHSMKMQVPIVRSHAFPRVLMEIVSFVMMLISFIQLIVLVAGKRNLLKGEGQRVAWMRMADEDSEDLCNFMTRNQCNGYDQQCTLFPGQCSSQCLGYVTTFGRRTCESQVTDAVINSLLPILVIVAICLVFIMVDVAFMGRFVKVARRLQRALF